MKNLITLLVGLLVCVIATAQNYVQQGDTFRRNTEVSSTSSVNAELTPYFYEVKSGDSVEKLPIYITKNNACYVIRVSKKTGKEYKYYLPKEIKEAIIKELGRQTNP